MDNQWQMVKRSSRFWSLLGIVVGILGVTAAGFTRLLLWVESRVGVRLSDPILEQFSPVSLSLPVFIGIYGGLLIAVGSIVRYPWRALQGLVAYTVLLWCRSVTLWLMPLDPPVTMIPLQDPLVQWLGTGGVVLTRDLFFSGHTATLCLLAMLVPRRWQRLCLSMLAVAVAAGLLMQHVHYSIDLFTAPFFAAAAYAVSRYAIQRWGARYASGVLSP